MVYKILIKFVRLLRDVNFEISGIDFTRYNFINANCLFNKLKHYKVRAI